MQAQRVLFRLYDLPPEPPASMSGDALCPWRVELASPLELRSLSYGWSGEDDERVLAPAVDSELLIAMADGKPVGCAGVNLAGRGVVGPVRFTAALGAGIEDRLVGELLHAALWRLRWLGYAYAMAAIDVAHHTPDELCAATWSVPPLDENVAASAREDASLEWADIFVDLRSWPLPPPVVALEVDGYPVQIRRPEASEQLLVVDWIKEEFGLGWAAEMQRAFAHDPISGVIVARRGYSENPRACLLGFIAYNTVRTGMLSSIALSEAVRGRSPEIAWNLLKFCLSEARACGFDYVVAGGVSRRLPALLGIRTAWTIPGSCPGVFGKGIRVR